MGHDDGQVNGGEQQLKQLERKVRTWKWMVTGFAVCLVATYLIYFGVHLGQSAATDASTWGTFGDFVGGLMNPVVAFAAFFWLTESVKIQKQELADTRAELSKASEAQNLLVENGRESVRLAAMTALLNINQNQIAHYEQRIAACEAGISDSITQQRNTDERMLGTISLLEANELRLKQDISVFTEKRQKLLVKGEFLAQGVEDILGAMNK